MLRQFEDMAIDMENKFERLKHDEVISTYNNQVLSLSRTIKVSEILEAVQGNFKGNTRLLFDEGLDWEVLRLDAKGWRKGKVRFSLEFCPDEPAVAETVASNKPENAQPESPLDDIRRMMNENS